VNPHGHSDSQSLLAEPSCCRFQDWKESHQAPVIRTIHRRQVDSLKLHMMKLVMNNFKEKVLHL
jgi:hypothetical protein